MFTSLRNETKEFFQPICDSFLLCGISEYKNNGTSERRKNAILVKGTKRRHFGQRAKKKECAVPFSKAW